MIRMEFSNAPREGIREPACFVVSIIMTGIALIKSRSL